MYRCAVFGCQGSAKLFHEPPVRKAILPCFPVPVNITDMDAVHRCADFSLTQRRSQQERVPRQALHPLHVQLKLFIDGHEHGLYLGFWHSCHPANGIRIPLDDPLMFDVMGIGETEIRSKHGCCGFRCRLPQYQCAQTQDCFPKLRIQLEGALQGNRK